MFNLSSDQRQRLLNFLKTRSSTKRLSDMAAVFDDEARQYSARVLCLSPDASWSDINTAALQPQEPS